MIGPWAIAGTGAVSSIASGPGPLLDALCAKRSGLAPLRWLDAQRFRAKYAFEIDDRMGDPGATARATRWLCDAIAQAIREAGVGEDLSEVPVLVGTGLRELRSIELRWTGHTDFPASRLHFGPALRERFGAARTYTLNNACSASLYALGMAADMIASGVEDVVVVAGADSISASMFGLMDRVQKPPVEHVEPFDRRRQGAIMGEGAAAVVLRRKGPARSWLRSVALNCDAHNETAPHRDGIAAAIIDAHRRAGVTAAEIGLVFAHGTATLLNDETEAAALTQTMVARGASPLVTGTKSLIGHTSGASGLMNVVVATEALRSGKIPPTTGLSEPVDEADGLRFVTETRTSGSVEVVQVNAFGFGGVNAVAILQRAG